MTLAKRFGTWLSHTMRRVGMDIDGTRGGGRAALADACGVSRSTAGRWIDGESMPSAEYFKPIAEALGVPLVDLLVGAGIMSPEDLAAANEAASVAPDPYALAESWEVPAERRDDFVRAVESLAKLARPTDG